jgi:phage I-like protein
MTDTKKMCFASRIRGVPSEIQVIPFGRHETEHGPFALDEEGAASIIADFNKRENDLVVDYEHQTLRGAEAPAAGWIKRLINKGKGGLWAAVEWTPRAVEYLKNREYRYLSPVFVKRARDGRVVRLLNAALTNQPAIDGMVPVVNKNSDGLSVMGNGSSDYASPITHYKGKEVSMEKLMELLGLPADAGQERAAQAVLAMKKRASAMEGVCSVLGLPEDAEASEINGTVMALTKGHEQAEAFAGRVAELEGLLRRKEAERHVEQAMKEGKVTPAQKDWAVRYAQREPEAFMAFAAKAPVLIHTGEAASGAAAPERGELYGQQRHVNAVLGIEEETFRNHNKTE